MTLLRLSILLIILAAAVPLLWLLRSGGLAGVDPSAAGTSHVSAAPSPTPANSSDSAPETTPTATPASSARDAALQPMPTDTAAGGATASTPPSSPPQTQLPAESLLMRDGGLSMSVIHRIRANPETFRAIEKQLQDDMARNELAADLGHLYRDAIAQQLAALEPGARVGAIACGLRLCVGTIEGLSDLQFDQWQSALGKDARTPNYALVGFRPDPTHGENSARFVFATDQSAGKFVGDARTTP